MEATDGVIAEWTKTLPKDEVHRRLSAYKVPCAPVRDLVEVTDDPHMHSRGMLERIDHPEFSEIVVHNSPIRLHGTDPVERTPSPRLSEHAREILTEFLGMAEAAVLLLEEDGVIGAAAAERT